MTVHAEDGTRVAGVETSAAMLVVMVLALSRRQIWCYRGCYRVAGIQEREAEAMVRAKETRVVGAELSGAVVVVMAMAGAAPHRDN